MATINGIYVHITSESINRGIESSTHPVENGVDITDHVKREPISLSISGLIVGENAADILNRLKWLQSQGSIISYIGRNICSNMQIQSFNTSHPNTVWGGCKFDMELKEVRIAGSSYTGEDNDISTKALTKGATKQLEDNKTSGEKVYHTVQKGDTAWYLGEKKYKSYGSSVEFITQNNSDAVPDGDWTKLQEGTKLWVYTKK